METKNSSQPNKNENPEQADIERARRESGNKSEEASSNEKPGLISDTDPQLSEDDLMPDEGATEAGPSKTM